MTGKCLLCVRSRFPNVHLFVISFAVDFRIEKGKSRFFIVISCALSTTVCATLATSFELLRCCPGQPTLSSGQWWLGGGFVALQKVQHICSDQCLIAAGRSARPGGVYGANSWRADFSLSILPVLAARLVYAVCCMVGRPFTAALSFRRLWSARSRKNAGAAYE